MTPEQRRTLAAIAGTIFPPGSESYRSEPGGAALGAHEYVIRALEGPYSRHRIDYLAVIDELDHAAAARAASSFVALGEADRTALAARLDRHSSVEEVDRSATGDNGYEPGGSGLHSIRLLNGWPKTARHYRWI